MTDIERIEQETYETARRTVQFLLDNPDKGGPLGMRFEQRSIGTMTFNYPVIEGNMLSDDEFLAWRSIIAEMAAVVDERMKLYRLFPIDAL